MSQVATVAQARQVRRADFMSMAILIFLVALPLYNLLVFAESQAVLPGINVKVADLRISDLYLLGWLVVVAPVLVRWHWVYLKSDTYLVACVVYLLWQVLRDVSLSAPGVIEYLPASVLFLVLYGAASRSNLRSLACAAAAKWAIVFYLVFAAGQVAMGAIEQGRVTSVFSNPNFLALYMLHMLVLLEFAVDREKPSRLWQGLAVVGVMVSRTRSVLAGILILLTYRIRSRWKYLLVGGAVVLMYAFPLLVRWEWENVSLLNGRISMWTTVAENSYEFDWIFGSGRDAIAEAELLPRIEDGVLVGYMQPQNDYIKIAAEHGLVGLLLWAAVIAAYLRKAWPVRRDRTVSVILCYIFVGMLIQLVECDVFQNPAVAVILGLGMARANQLRAKTYQSPAGLPRAKGGWSSPRT